MAGHEDGAAGQGPPADPPLPAHRAGDAPPAALVVSGVGVVRRGRALLRDVDLEVRPGEHWALLGPNGAGKTTLLTLLGAAGHPTSGTVDVLGHRLGRVDLRELRRRIGHVDPRHRMLGDHPVRDVVLTGLTGSTDLPPRWEPSAAESARAVELAAAVGLAGRVDARWSVLSQGERGRALLARALVAAPDLLLLDEPATGLDVAARELLLDVVDDLRAARPGHASVTVTHHLEDLPASTSHALLLRDGAVLAQGPADAVLTSELVSHAFDHPLVVERTGGRWSARSARSR